MWFCRPVGVVAWSSCCCMHALLLSYFASGGCPTHVLLCCYVCFTGHSRGCPVCVVLHALLLLALLLSYFSQSGVACLVWSFITQITYYLCLIFYRPISQELPAALPLVESLKFRSVGCFADMRRRHSGAVCCFVARCFTSWPVYCFVMLFYSTTTNSKVCSLINFTASLSLLWGL